MSERKVFEVLDKINVNEFTEKKNGLTYLSWAFAWKVLLSNFPDSTYKIYENDKGWNYFTDGNTCWVKTGVTVEGIELIEYLPVMDYKNKSIASSNVTFEGGSDRFVFIPGNKDLFENFKNIYIFLYFPIFIYRK